MKHHYLKEKPANNYNKEQFQFRPVHNEEHPVYRGKTGFAGDSSTHQIAPPKNDSPMQDFFGALNY